MLFGEALHFFVLIFWGKFNVRISQNDLTARLLGQHVSPPPQQTGLAV